MFVLYLLLLGSDHYPTRETASASLRALNHDPWVRCCVAALAHWSRDPEVRHRAKEIGEDYYNVWPSNSRVLPRLDSLLPRAEDRDLHASMLPPQEDYWNGLAYDDDHMRGLTATFAMRLLGNGRSRESVVKMLDEALRRE